VLLMQAVPRQPPFTPGHPVLRVIGADEKKLRSIEGTIPLGRLVWVTGVSGWGKYTLVEGVLYKKYLRLLREAVSEAGACERIEGFGQIGEMVHTGQELPARSLRSNPATYVKVYDEIRRLFAACQEGRRLRIKPRDFSFNVDGGRCEKCHGTG